MIKVHLSTSTLSNNPSPLVPSYVSRVVHIYQHHITSNQEHMIEKLVTLKALPPKAVTNEYSASDR